MSYTELKYSNPISRKDYNCEWCSEKIVKGTKHMARTYIYEGNFNSGRMHKECEAAMNRAHKHEIDISDGWEPGEFKRGTCESS